VVGDKYNQDGVIAVDESIIRELFGIMRENTAAVASVDKKLTELSATIREREKGCDTHNRKTDKLEGRVHILEIWQAGQDGLGAFMWKALPLCFAAISLGVAIYVGMHK